jgi:tetratricopeptide (TPR) repeat protein
MVGVGPLCATVPPAEPYKYHMTQQMHFQRFISPDQHLLKEQIDQGRLNLQTAEGKEDPLQVLDVAGVLGSMLTTARKEAEARELLLNYLPLAQQNESAKEVGWFLLALATANQYLELREEANEQFSKALRLARLHRWTRLEHFVLHHWGRSLVEEGRLNEARECFISALHLRETMNEPFQASTCEALAALDEIEQESGSLSGPKDLS